MRVVYTMCRSYTNSQQHDINNQCVYMFWEKSWFQTFVALTWKHVNIFFKTRYPRLFYQCRSKSQVKLRTSCISFVYKSWKTLCYDMVFMQYTNPTSVCCIWPSADRATITSAWDIWFLQSIRGLYIKEDVLCVIFMHPTNEWMWIPQSGDTTVLLSGTPQ